MADSKISALTAATAAAAANEFAINEAGTSKKLSLSQILSYLQAGNGLPRVKKLTADHAISSTTGTEVTDLSMTLEAGTYVVEYYLICQTATTTVGPMFGVNFTGTAAVKTLSFQFPDGSTALTAYTANMDNEGVKGLGVVSGMATQTYSTTAPNLGTTVGATNANVDCPAYIRGVLVVTASGDLELWHSSETATSTTLMAGSCAVVTRCA